MGERASSFARPVQSDLACQFFEKLVRKPIELFIGIALKATIDAIRFDFLSTFAFNDLIVVSCLF